MATINHVPTVLASRRMQQVLWETVTCGDTGDSFEVPTWAVTVTVQVTGTFNSQILTMQGSNDGSNWATLTDPQGNSIALTAAGIEVIEEYPRYVRPTFSGSSGGDVDVLLFLRR